MKDPVNEYDYGSQVYKTADDESDVDIISIVDDDCLEEYEFLERHPCWPHNHDYSFYSISQFKEMIVNHDPCALECLFLPDEFKNENYSFSFELDVSQLRRSFSQKSSNSWVKAKKKIDLHKEYRLGRKSLFHSLRIINFGIQIISHEKIVDYSSANHYWEKIVEQNYTSWKDYKEYWQPEYNKIHSEFKKLAPLKG